MMQAPIRIAIIGTGLIVKGRHLPTLQAIPQAFKVVALCNRSLHKAQQLNEAFHLGAHCFSHVESMQAEVDFDVALVCVPIDETPKIVEQLLLGGKAVICEKPIADNTEAGRRLLDLARNKNLPFFIAENHRLRTAYHLVKQLLHDKVIGTPHLLHLNDLHFTPSDNQWFKTAWRRSGDHQGGYIYDGGVHLVAALRIIFPQAIEHISALFSYYQCPEEQASLLMQMHFDNGACAQLALGDRYTDPYSRQMKIYGNEGTLIVNTSQVEIWKENEKTATYDIAIQTIQEENQCMWLSLADALSHQSLGEGHCLSAHEGLKDIEILEAGLVSARKYGELITLK